MRSSRCLLLRFRQSAARHIQSLMLRLDSCMPMLPISTPIDCICLYVCVYICTCMCVYIRMCVRMHTCIYVCMYVYTHTDIRAGIRACQRCRSTRQLPACLHVYVCLYVRTYVRMHACIYVCIYVCMFSHRHAPRLMHANAADQHTNCLYI